MSLCDGLGLGKFNVMGFHTGSVIALEMGRSFPDRIKKIIPIGIPLMEVAQQKELSEKYSSSDSELEERISEIAAEKLIEDNNEMPKVPEPLPPPKSLGNLLNHMMESAEEGEETTIRSLSERAAETQEDIEERQAISSEIQAIEDEKLSQVLDELISTDEES